MPQLQDQQRMSKLRFRLILQIALVLVLECVILPVAEVVEDVQAVLEHVQVAQVVLVHARVVLVVRVHVKVAQTAVVVAEDVPAVAADVKDVQVAVVVVKDVLAVAVVVTAAAILVLMTVILGVLHIKVAAHLLGDRDLMVKEGKNEYIRIKITKTF